MTFEQSEHKLSKTKLVKVVAVRGEAATRGKVKSGMVLVSVDDVCCLGMLLDQVLELFCSSSRGRMVDVLLGDESLIPEAAPVNKPDPPAPLPELPSAVRAAAQLRRGAPPPVSASVAASPIVLTPPTALTSPPRPSAINSLTSPPPPICRPSPVRPRHSNSGAMSLFESQLSPRLSQQLSPRHLGSMPVMQLGNSMMQLGPDRTQQQQRQHSSSQQQQHSSR